MQMAQKITVVLQVLICLFALQELGILSASPGPASITFDGTAFRPVYVDAYGDSTMEGLSKIDGVYGMVPNNQPMQLQMRLQAQFGTQVRVWNQGVSGSNLRQLLDGSGGRYRKPFAERMQESAAHIVLANFGINDAEASTLDQYKANIDTFVKLARAHGKIPVLEEPNPVCDPSPAPKNIPRIEQQVAFLNDYAAENHVPLVKQYAFIKSLPDWRNRLVDCIHPTADLYEIEAERIAMTIAPIVRRLAN